MNPSDNKHIARSWFDAMNQRDFAAIDRLFATDYILHYPGIPEGARGGDVIRELVSAYVAAFPDLRFTVTRLIAEADTVLVAWTAEGTHQGTLMGLEASGRRARWEGTSVLRVRDGRIAEDWVLNDQLSMLQQLGLVQLGPIPMAHAAGVTAG
jgi:steroid delta-isomerase-like uncharacterized protein